MPIYFSLLHFNLFQSELTSNLRSIDLHGKRFDSTCHDIHVIVSQNGSYCYHEK